MERFRAHRRFAPGLLLVGALVAAGCRKDSMQGPSDGQVPDFSLLDVNSTSPSFDTKVSPRDHVGQVTAWYFGHAT